MNNYKATTPWFSGRISPAYVGVYERRYTRVSGKVTNYAYWDGSFWYEARTTPGMAVLAKTWSIFQKDRFEWRGLSKRPVHRPFSGLRALWIASKAQRATCLR